MSYKPYSKYDKLSAGEILYVDAAQADDTENGYSPNNAKKTINAAIAAASVSDKIVIKAGTYVEDVVMNKANMEMFGEIGTVLDGTGTCLSLTAANCRVNGNIKVTPGDTQTGVLIDTTATECFIKDLKVVCNSLGDCGFDIAGAGAVLEHCRSGLPKAAGEKSGFKVRASQVILHDCETAGNGATIGLWIASGSVIRANDFSSAGHSVAGYQIDTGATGVVLKDFSSGGGDGKCTDADDTAVISNFTFDNEVYKSITFAAGTTEWNLFKITGGVRISDITAHIETVIPGVASTIYLQLYSANGTVDITDAPGVDIDAAVAGSVLVRNGPSTDPLDLANPDSLPAVNENTSYRDPKTAIDVVKDDSADTYLRLVMSAAQASGEIHFHCHYEPLTDDGFLEAA